LFTGLIVDLGTVSAIDATPDGARLRIQTRLAPGIGAGDSVAINGVCLTATEVGDDWFDAEAVNQTLRMTALGGLLTGDRVNLELPLRASERLGGHLVQGHVDGVGEVVEADEDGFALRLRIDVGEELMNYVVEHGSVAVNGVSLTVAGLDNRSFTVSLIPETRARTNLGAVAPGARVNLEVDVLARYVEKAVQRMVAR
jgi:riboflavin synthase